MEQIGPYPYEKIANVQAAGMSGGTEHASVIFYGEKGVAAGRAPVVHEIAHQWWGNAVTERDWDDVWLSEGFATYFALLFTEHDEGRDAFVRGCSSVATRCSSSRRSCPTRRSSTATSPTCSRVLNRLMYEKGGWVLHMLRAEIGTETFWQGIRDYYRRYRDRNASTPDLRAVMEQVSGKPLDWFFTQWLTRPAFPGVEGTWRYDAARKMVDVTVSQTQAAEPYRLTVEVGVTDKAGALPRVARVELTGRQATVSVPAETEPAAVMLDRDVAADGRRSLRSHAVAAGAAVPD